MESFWLFDQCAFKDASSFILLDDINDKSETDIGIKKLITEQFDHMSDLHFWIKNNFEKVNIAVNKPFLFILGVFQTSKESI